MTIGIPPDPALSGAGGLFDDGGARSVTAFLEARQWRVEDLRPVQAIYSPGRSCAVRYRAKASGPSGSSRTHDVTLETRLDPRRSLEPGRAFAQRHGVTDPIGEVDGYLAWTFPYDPSLRGLDEAAWGPSVRAALPEERPRPVAVAVSPLRYRPRRRAVFRYKVLYREGEGNRVLFGKVLRTVRARQAMEHAAMISKPRRRFGRGRARSFISLPVGNVSPNVLLYEPATGTCLRDLLMKGGSLPEPRRLIDLMHGVRDLHRQVGDHGSPRHSRALESLGSTQTLLSHIVPEARDDVSFVASAIQEASSDAQVEHCVVHGDLYDAQIFVRDDFSLELVDADDLGVGDPALDAANLSAHLVALAAFQPSIKDRLLAYRSVVREAFLSDLGISSEDLRWREALVMLQLAAGPFRVLAPEWPRRVTQHIRLARMLLDGAS